MSERKYSVAEIDRMREAIADANHWWSLADSARTETRLRTYMMNGTDPEELEQVAREAEQLRNARDARKDPA